MFLGIEVSRQEQDFSESLSREKAEAHRVISPEIRLDTLVPVLSSPCTYLDLVVYQVVLGLLRRHGKYNPSTLRCIQRSRSQNYVGL